MAERTVVHDTIVTERTYGRPPDRVFAAWRTTDINRPITYQNLADDVAGFMDAVGLKKADVFGYSMGAIAGLQLAIRHPHQVNRPFLKGQTPKGMFEKP